MLTVHFFYIGYLGTAPHLKAFDCTTESFAARGVELLARNSDSLVQTSSRIRVTSSARRSIALRPRSQSVLPLGSRVKSAVSSSSPGAGSSLRASVATRSVSNSYETLFPALLPLPSPLDTTLSRSTSPYTINRTAEKRSSSALVRLVSRLYRIWLKLVFFPFTLIKAVLFWFVPLLVVWFISFWISFSAGLLVYLYFYRAYSPSRLATFPVFFDQRPHPLLLTPHYTRYSSLKDFAPDNILYPSLHNGNCAQPIYTQNATRYSLNSICPTFRSDGNMNKKEAQNDEVNTRPGLDETIRMFPRDEATLIKQDIAVGFMTFDNKTWEYIDSNGLSMKERCLLYHRARHLGLHKTAFEILQDNAWRKPYFASSRQLKSHSGSSGVDFYFEFQHIPLLSTGPDQTIPTDRSFPSTQPPCKLPL